MPGFKRDRAYLAAAPCGCRIYYSFSFDNGRTYEIDFCTRHKGVEPITDSAGNTIIGFTATWASANEANTIKVERDNMTIDDLLTTLRNPAGKSEDELKEAMFEAANMLEDYKRGVDALNAIVDKEKD